MCHSVSYLEKWVYNKYCFVTFLFFLRSSGLAFHVTTSTCWSPAQSWSPREESWLAQTTTSTLFWRCVLYTCMWDNNWVTLSITIQIFICESLQHINELTMKLDLQTVLCGAEAIYLQLIQCKVRGPSLASKIQNAQIWYCSCAYNEEQNSVMSNNVNFFWYLLFLVKYRKNP